ncbi:unnamed protein product [Macrosiphum euphorbiae]|uniref:Uncharacterized protein n=1 Tax=Macrosiphum euphorbiae TaxID=13131 RepID=A0AAV0XU39_9HEMI|nr:unnamed protein product [Macrosiphum euphorbiae]
MRGRSFVGELPQLMVLPRFGPCTTGSRWAQTPPPGGVTRWLSPVTDPLFERSRSEPRPPPPRRHQVAKPSDRPTLHEVAVKTSQRPNPRRFRCVRAPGADPDWSFPF